MRPSQVPEAEVVALSSFILLLEQQVTESELRDQGDIGLPEAVLRSEVVKVAGEGSVELLRPGFCLQALGRDIGEAAEVLGRALQLDLQQGVEEVLCLPS